MEKNLKNKKKLVLTLAVITIMIMTIIPTVIAPPPEERPLKDFDWNHWQNKPHMFSIPPGNVGIGTPDPEEKLTLGFLNNFAIEMEPPKSVEVAPATGGELTQGLTYYFRVVACLGLTTTMPSMEVDCYLEGGTGNNRCSLTWDPVIGATHYRVYMGTEEGNQTRYQTAYTNLYNYDNDISAVWEEPPKTTTAYVNKISSLGNSWFLGGNIGIGKIPDEELDVEGDIQISGDYKYSSEKTYYYNIPVESFILTDSTSDTQWYIPGTGYGYIKSYGTVGSAYLNCPVYLPDGATIKEFKVYYYDNDVSKDASFYFFLFRRNVASTSVTGMATCTPSFTGDSTSIQKEIDDSISPDTVDNRYYQYYIDAGWHQLSAPGDSLRFYGCRIEYTMDTISP